MKPTPKELILEMAGEDYTGPWEFVWDASQRWAGAKRAATVAMLQPAALELLTERQIRVFIEVVGQGIRPLDGALGKAALESRSAWEDPLPGQSTLIRVALSSMGGCPTAHVLPAKR
jgi:hypothetical protein